MQTSPSARTTLNTTYDPALNRSEIDKSISYNSVSAFPSPHTRIHPQRRPVSAPKHGIRKQQQQPPFINRHSSRHSLKSGRGIIMDTSGYGGGNSSLLTPQQPKITEQSMERNITPE